MRTQHVFDLGSVNKGKNAFCGPWNHDSYKGDYLIEPSPAADMRMYHKSIGACSVIRALSRTKQSFRRSWTHIQEDATDVVVLCFVKHGYLRLEHSSGEVVARAGDVLATKSIAPFLLECGAGGDDIYEAIHLIVPMHMLRHHLCDEVSVGFCVPAKGRNFSIAECILGGLVDDQGDISEASARLLIEAAIGSLADAIKSDGSMPTCPNNAELRMRVVLRYIDLHLSDPALSVGLAAGACGVSQRYIFSLFKKNGTTFTSIVWRKRLDVAAQWLSTSSPNEASIRKIAYKSGFKSAAHFARMFKREFRQTPRRFRETALQKPGKSGNTLVIDSEASRH